MNTVVWWYYIVCIAVGYLCGCLNTAAIIARCKGFDIRTKGSGNAGASNALVTMGKGAAVITALCDIFKAFIPVLAVRFLLSGVHLPVVTGIAVILGHMFPFWMQFRGGKGYASLLGMILALDWRFFLVCMVILGLILLITRFIAIATVTCALALPVYWQIMTGEWIDTVLLTALAVLIFSKHIQNFKRIKDGTEIPLGKKKKTAASEETPKE